MLEESLTLRSGSVINLIDKSHPDFNKYLTRSTLSQLHLVPGGEPAAFSYSSNNEIVFYFDPLYVKEAPPQVWYTEASGETMTLASGNVIEKMSIARAAAHGYYTRDKLASMFYNPIEEPVAYTINKSGNTVYYYDKATSLRLPMPCVKCGQDHRYRHKLCKACYEEDLAIRRAEGDALRAASYSMNPEKVLFFDLELTGFYDRDEIISISIVDGGGNLIMNTLVKPDHTKSWKKTEKIHGITPEMVEDAPLLVELSPEIKRLFADCDKIIAYGVSTDFSHIKKIYETEEEQNTLREKVCCCANEYVRFIHEHHPELSHASLIDAMDCLGIEWTGVPHSSLADTYACKDVWNTLFPNYYN